MSYSFGHFFHYLGIFCEKNPLPLTSTVWFENKSFVLFLSAVGLKFSIAVKETQLNAIIVTKVCLP